MRPARALLLCLVAGCASAGRDPESGWIIHQAPHPSPTAAYRLVEIMLEASARSVDRIGARPTILSREMAVAVTAMYDAWAAYDDKAVGTRLGDKLRRPAAERTIGRKERAMSHAMRFALLWLYPEDQAWIDGQLRPFGVDTGRVSVDLATPEGIGTVAAMTLIEYREHDGANQLGAKPYADTTGYQPKNPPDKIVDPDRWQQIPFDDGKGGTIYVSGLTPHWGKVKPFALDRSDQFRPGPFPKVGTEQLKKEVDECIAFNGGLTLEQKAIVEFMRDGPRSTGQSGHWLRFSQDVSRRDSHDLDRDVKLFFCIANVVFDAFIACWEAKYHYDSSRPWTLIRHLYQERPIVGYRGPRKGFATIPASNWHPYSPSVFVTPPFPGYPSGHSTASMASARILELFTGSDRYEAVAFRKAGELTEPGCDPALMQARDGKAPADCPKTTDVRLPLPTFTATAEMAGISRIMGGYHIQADNVAGLELGRKVADHSWPKYQAYFSGKKP